MNAYTDGKLSISYSNLISMS